MTSVLSNPRCVIVGDHVMSWFAIRVWKFLSSACNVGHHSREGLGNFPPQYTTLVIAVVRDPKFPFSVCILCLVIAVLRDSEISLHSIQRWSSQSWGTRKFPSTVYSVGHRSREGPGNFPPQYTTLVITALRDSEFPSTVYNVGQNSHGQLGYIMFFSLSCLHNV